MSCGHPLPILMYHHISPRPGLVTCSPENFRAQMTWLALNGWKTLDAERFAKGLTSGKFPPKTILITFDDGYLDNWVYAYPILKELGLSATVFLITDWVGDGPPRPNAGQRGVPPVPDHVSAMNCARAGQFDDAFLRWSEVELMQAGGVFNFHSHTHTHTRWDRQIENQFERNFALAEDLQASRATLKTRLGQDSSHLCWPQGYFDSDYQQVALECGFTHLYTTEPGVVWAETDGGRIPRLVVKDKPASWFALRMAIYGHRYLSRLYLGVKPR